MPQWVRVLHPLKRRARSERFAEHMRAVVIDISDEQEPALNAAPADTFSPPMPQRPFAPNTAGQTGLFSPAGSQVATALFSS